MRILLRNILWEEGEGDDPPVSMEVSVTPEPEDSPWKIERMALSAAKAEYGREIEMVEAIEVVDEVAREIENLNQIIEGYEEDYKQMSLGGKMALAQYINSLKKEVKKLEEGRESEG